MQITRKRIPAATVIEAVATLTIPEIATYAEKIIPMLLVEARIGDQARPFHPDEATEPDVQASADKRAVGGLGWFFIKQVMTEVDYRSTPQGNCLRLRRRLTAPPTACPPADPTAPAHTAP